MAKKPKNHPIFAVVGVPPEDVRSIWDDFKNDFSKNKKQELKFLLILDDDKKINKKKFPYKWFDFVEQVNFNKPSQLIDMISRHEDSLVGVTCRAEARIPDFAKLVPHVAYLEVPTSESLRWSVDKVLMRKRFKAYDSKITPAFSVVKDSSVESINRLERNVRYPMIVKPSNMAQSLLVTPVYHRDELEKALKRIFAHLKKVAEKTEVLVEYYMEGEQYSIDTYVDHEGRTYHCPIVHIKTGKQIGFDDFFGYRQMTPTKLKTSSEESARVVCDKAIRALRLKSCTAHIELMRTEEGWKVIELGPRVGGFREELYQLSYGFNHAVNDLLIRMDKKPKIKRRISGYTAALKIFAKKEGIIEKIVGVKKLNKLESFHSIENRLKVKDKASFAKNGGKSVFNIILHNKDRSRLLADIRRLETTVEIHVR